MLREGREITISWLFLAATLNTPWPHTEPAISGSCWWQSKISALAACSSLSIPQPWSRSFSSRCFKYSCPSFSWDRVNFLPGSWCHAVFWIWDENSVDNTLVFLVVAEQSRIFQLRMLAWPAGCMGSWERLQLGQLTPAAQRDVLFRMVSRSVNQLGGLAGGQ